MEREFTLRVRQGSVKSARAWYRRQSLRVAGRACIDRLRGLRWGGPRDPRGLRQPRVIHLPGLYRDLQYAVRSLVKRPLHTSTVVGTLALSIGANTAVFSIVNSVLLRPLPYPEPEELVTVGRSTRVGSVSFLDFRDWREETTTLEEFAAYTLARETYLAEGLAEEWLGVETTPELFRLLGARPLLGRLLDPIADSPEIGSTAIVISHRLWREQFGADEDVIGRQIRFEDQTRTIVGVASPDFAFPSPREQYWTTLADHAFLENRGAWFLKTLGRLAPGSDLADVQRELNVVAVRIDNSPDGSTDSERVVVDRYHEALVGDTRPLFALLVGAVTLVLAIACANLANLGLTHAIRRRREFAVRAALGAGTARLVRQTFVEHLLLAGLGGVSALVLAWTLVSLFLAVGPTDLPRREQIGIDGATFAFTAVVAVLCGLFFGTAPALRHAGADVREGLQVAPRHGVGRSSGRLMAGLAAAQIALALILTSGAGLFINSFARLVSVEPGFNAESVVTINLHLPLSRYGDPDAVGRYYDDAARRLTALQGVSAAAYTSHLPFSPSDLNASYYLPGETADTERDPAALEVVDGPYFRVMGIPLLEGRELGPSDRPGSGLNVVINRTMAALHWPGRSALGERLTFDEDFAEDRWMTVVGVVEDVLRSGLDDDRGRAVYLARAQFTPVYTIISGRNGYLAVHTDGDPRRRIGDIMGALRSMDAHVPFTNIRTTGELVGDSISAPRFRTVLLTSFAALAVLVAMVGIYGVLAFGVAQRWHEFGIRMALGANRRAIRRHVLARGIRLLAFGVPIGVIGAVMGGRWVGAMLYGVEPADPLTLALGVVAFSGLALAACVVPAMRAADVSPVTSMRRE